MTDQEALFNYIVVMPLNEQMYVVKDDYEMRHIRLTNIKSTQFIIPSKEATIEKISISDCIPFLDESQDARKRDFFLRQALDNAQAKINIYYEEIKDAIQAKKLQMELEKPEKQSPQLMKQSASNMSVTSQNTDIQNKREAYHNSLREISELNSATVDPTSLSMLLFITQTAISDLKNAKSKRIDNYRDMPINPVELLILLKNFDQKNRVGKY